MIISILFHRTKLEIGCSYKDCSGEKAFYKFVVTGTKVCFFHRIMSITILFTLSMFILKALWRDFQFSKYYYHPSNIYIVAKIYIFLISNYATSKEPFCHFAFTNSTRKSPEISWGGTKARWSTQVITEAKGNLLIMRMTLYLNVLSFWSK